MRKLKKDKTENVSKRNVIIFKIKQKTFKTCVDCVQDCHCMKWRHGKMHQALLAFEK